MSKMSLSVDPRHRPSKVVVPVSTDGQVIALDEARRFIETAREAGDASALLGIRDAASRWQFQLQRRASSRTLADDAGEIKIRAEQALAVIDVRERPRGRPEKDSTPGTFLADLRVETRAAIRKLAPLSDARLSELIEDARGDDMWGVTTAHVLALLTGHMGGLKGTTGNEWYTPARYIEAARAVMGGVDLDPASSELANQTVKAETYWGIEDTDEHGNGSLDRDWFGRVWLNPPYGKGSGEFTIQLTGEYDAGRVEQAVLLLNAYGFDSDWFTPLWRHPICFTDHRVEFTSPLRKSGGPANGNIFVYLGPEPATFRDVFSEFGHVVRTWDEAA